MAVSAAIKRQWALEDHFMFLHQNPPAPFNPDFDPKATERGHKAAQSMETDGYYQNHSRQECASEYRRRYDRLKEGEV